ncbi:hypothetical protein NDU88_005981 [Pleurodeles waltl]|uniref:Uncharacterized protein n=1 Tax=Pleurodeles waltl TaxID=8319 RepID=A0AAV7L2G9_PLEWA|nr:hypothetical protein NDU88_005981 [Pleurodeles waltl]
MGAGAAPPVSEGRGLGRCSPMGGAGGVAGGASRGECEDCARRLPRGCAAASASSGPGRGERARARGRGRGSPLVYSAWGYGGGQQARGRAMHALENARSCHRKSCYENEMIRSKALCRELFFTLYCN